MKMRNICLVVNTVSLITLFYSCQSPIPDASATTQISKQPNILWLVCEDQSDRFFPFYGDSTVTLPHLEKLANEGVVYENMYAPVPVCAPARSGIITGMYPTSLGTHNMRTYNAYKADNEPSINIPSYSPLPPAGVKPFTEYLRKAGYYCTNNAKEDYNFAPLASMWDESGKEAHWRKKSEGQPFFAVFNFNITHEAPVWMMGDKELLTDPKKVPVPPYFPDDSIVRHDLAVNYSNLIRMDEQVGKILQQLEEDSLTEETLIFFYGDHGGPFPRHKRSLYETGTRVPFVIRFPSKKDRGTRNRELLNFIDFAPTVLSLAGIAPPNYLQGQAFLGKYKTKEQREYVFTTSDRFDGCYDRKRAVRGERYKYIKNYKPEIPYALPVKFRLQMPMMRQLLALKASDELQGASKLWLTDEKPKEELYDLKNDPDELNNLATTLEYEETVQRFRGILNEWIEKTNDLGETAEREILEKSRPQGQPRILNSPKVEQNEKQVSLSSEEENATLVWQKNDAMSWYIYDAPIAVNTGDTLRVKSVQIGYEESPVIEVLGN